MQQEGRPAFRADGTFPDRTLRRRDLSGLYRRAAQMELRPRHGVACLPGRLRDVRRHRHLQLRPQMVRQHRHRRRLHPGLQPQPLQLGQDFPRQIPLLFLRRDARREIPQGHRAGQEPARRTAAHPFRRLLVQGSLSQPDLAGRRLHGLSLLCRIRRPLPVRRGADRRLQRHRGRHRHHPRQMPGPGDGPAAPRLRRIRQDVLVRPGHQGPVVPLLGPRARLLLPRHPRGARLAAGALQGPPAPGRHPARDL